MMKKALNPPEETQGPQRIVTSAHLVSAKSPELSEFEDKATSFL
jgi:predicted MarR family transcription regulator